VFQKKPARRHTQTSTSTKTYQPPNQHAGMKQALRYANNEKLLNYPDWKERVHKACIRACEGDQTRTGIIMLYLSRWSSPLMSSQIRSLCQSFAHRFNIWLFRSSLLSYYCCDPVNRASWLPPHYWRSLLLTGLTECRYVASVGLNIQGCQASLRLTTACEHLWIRTRNLFATYTKCSTNRYL